MQALAGTVLARVEEMFSSFPFFVFKLRSLEFPLDLGVNERVKLENREGADLI